MSTPQWNSPLTTKVLVLVLAANAALSLLATSLDLYQGFHRQDEALYRVTDQIERGFGTPLSSALSFRDTQQIDQILDDIFADGAVASLSLSTEQQGTWTRGPQQPEAQLRTAAVTLIHSDPARGGATVGVLEVGLSRAQIWSDLYAQAPAVFLSNIAKTGIASIAVLLIFSRLVGRHLRQIASLVSKPDWLTDGEPLVLDRPDQAGRDDLDAITAAVNGTRAQFEDMDGDLPVVAAQLQLVLDTARSGIIGLGADRMIEVINPAARHMLGDRSDQTPFPWPKQIEFVDVSNMQALDTKDDPLKRAISGQPLIGETHALTQTDPLGNRYVRISSTAVEDRDSPLRSVIVLDDVSHLERNRQQVERQGRLDALGQLTGGVAHDFNNLLATILYALQLIRTDTLSDRSDRVLTTALGAVERGQELTGRLLAFARRQPGAAKSRTISQVFSDFEAHIRTAIEDEVAITFAPTDPDLLVHCDQGQLDNALLDLVLNSRDAILRSGTGGQITLKARPIDDVGADVALGREDPFAFVAAGMREAHSEDMAREDARTHRYVEISVTDDGPGMSKEIKGRALDPFFTTKDETAASGLGLSMVYGFIQGAKGELRIYSEPGFGSTIRMILPRGTATDEREDPVTLQPRRRGAGQNILVVEDEENLLDVTRDLLQELGYTCLPAKTADEALRLIEGSAHVDLMLTDIVMPGGVSGFELARRARRHLPDLPIVYMSGYTGFKMSQMADVAGPMLQKPCAPVQLAEVLADALSTQKAVP